MDHNKTIMLRYGRKDQPRTEIHRSKESVTTLKYFNSLLEKLYLESSLLAQFWTLDLKEMDQVERVQKQTSTA